MSDDGAKILAEWLGYAWDGLGDQDISDRYPDWSYGGCGHKSPQGGKPAFRKIVQAITAAEHDAAIARAEAAEAQVAKLREALGRFAATSERVNAAMMQPPDDDHDFTPDRGRTIVGLLKELLVEMGQHARAALEPAHD